MKNLQRKVAAMERAAGGGSDTRVPIIWDGKTEELCREQVEEARERRAGIHLICIEAMEHADTPAEAAHLIAKHREEGRVTPIKVYLKGSAAEVLLAEWDPGLPAWLQGAT